MGTINTDQKNKKIVWIIVFVLIGMAGLTWASVPLYRLFCQVTGYGGTTRDYIKPSNQIGRKKIKINFDANINSDLKWIFKPEQLSINVRTGENSLIFYYAENLTNEALKGMAVYNVVPQTAGKYFNKVECFCFSEQTLQPFQKVNMPVLFFIDPKIEEDETLKDVTEITLSYNFFKAE